MLRTKMRLKNMNLSGAKILAIYSIGIPFISSLFPEGELASIVTSLGIVTLGVYTVTKVKDELSPFFMKLEQLNQYSYIVAIISMLIIIFGILLSFLKSEFGAGINRNQEVLLYSMSSMSIVQTISVAIFVPIIEEVFFKYYLFKKTTWFKTKRNFKILILSLLFVTFHCFYEIFTLNAMVGFDALYYLIFSVATFIAYIKTDNLLFPISIHMICNIVALIL